jgi:paraquat-inducible protein B
MSGASGGGAQDPRPVARTQRSRFSTIWIIPVVALVIAIFLGYRTISSRGALITVQFQSAEGLTAGQTQVKHKNVALGTVEGIKLTHDMRTVLVNVRMTHEADGILTDKTRFWVVRPRLSGSSISGLETLVSGAYIAVDPGGPGGNDTRSFVGLESPPGVRSDEPGRTYTLMTGDVKSVGEGSPVFFRGLTVGEVLGYKLPPSGRGPIPVQIFVRSPYDQFVRVDSRFWNDSGVEVTFGGGGLKLQIESLQAVLSGGIGFGISEERRGVNVPTAPDDAVFKLYDTQSDADSAGYHRRVAFATYLQSSVKGLEVGSEVDLYGIQIGNVTDIKLELDAVTGQARVRVGMEVQPERVFSSKELQGETPAQIASKLVQNGMRAQLSSASFITGASLISFEFVPNAQPAAISMEGDTIVLPSEKGGLSGITDSLSDVAAKLDALPLTQIASHLDDVLAGTSRRINSPDLTAALHQLSGTLASIHGLADHANHGLTPLLQRLPAMADQLQATLKHANTLLESYGGNSDFSNNVSQLLAQLSDTARSLRMLSDYLTRHPNSLVFGRSAPGRHQ